QASPRTLGQLSGDLGIDGALPGNQPGVDTEQAGLDVAPVGHDRATDDVGGTRRVHERGAHEPAGEGLGRGHRLVGRTQRGDQGGDVDRLGHRATSSAGACAASRRASMTYCTPVTIATANPATISTWV